MSDEAANGGNSTATITAGMEASDSQAAEVKATSSDVVPAEEKTPAVEAEKKTKNDGTYAAIKQEFLDPHHERKLVTDYLPPEYVAELQAAAAPRGEKRPGDQPAADNQAKKVKLKGRNKQRPIQKTHDRDRLCPSIVRERECSFGAKCRYSHDIKRYLVERPKTVEGKECYLFQKFGKCPYGVTCIFADTHLSEDLKNVVNEDLYKTPEKEPVLNTFSKELQKKLWKRRYDFSRANQKIEEITGNKPSKYNPKPLVVRKSDQLKAANAPDDHQGANAPNDHQVASEPQSDHQVASEPKSGALTDEDVIKLRPGEKKTIDFRDKLYLAPLTTVGNLPFRRVCKNYGVDITCGEMAMATNILQGAQSELALLKRHESEDIFGVQLCGGFPDSMTRCAQLLCETCDIDFIDINCGCPIDLVYKRGEGSALMGRLSKFEQIIRGMVSVMDVPLTVKMRTGIEEGKLTAHTLVPRLAQWGVSALAVHGRTREQRYTRLADWDYISKCATEAGTVPLYGGGDILSFEDANLRRQETGVAGLMIARGALIKPWIFTEIKEQRHWDISSSERFDMLKDFSNYGLEHWGSDRRGVETTRRFLLEWLSFLHRYIPVGLLERLPQRINEKPPYYVGRNDLETKMASANCADWVQISEMLLGPVPEGFTFLPKHKANAYR